MSWEKSLINGGMTAAKRTRNLIVGSLGKSTTLGPPSWWNWRRTLILSTCLLATSPLSAAWNDGRSQGWAWYEEKAKQPEKSVEEEVVQSPSDQLAQIRKDLEDSLSQALLNPTPENVIAYMRDQKKWVDQSALFASLWRLALLEDPVLDPTVEVPTSQYGLQVHKDKEGKERSSRLLALGRECGLFFFFQGDCPYSEALSRVVDAFGQRHHWEVVPVSLDGSSLENFPSPRQDNGIAQSFGVARAPAVFVVNPTIGLAVPVSYGLTTLDTLEKNVLMQLGGSHG